MGTCKIGVHNYMDISGERALIGSNRYSSVNSNVHIKSIVFPLKVNISSVF